jgi:hypothetical protein
MRGMETTANTTVDTAASTTEQAPAQSLLDPALTVLEEPMSVPAALKAMDEDGSLTAVVAVDLDAMLDGRGYEEAGEDYVIVRAMVTPELIPVQMRYDLVGHREGNVLLVRGTFDLREAVCAYYSAEEIDEFEAQNA